MNRHGAQIVDLTEEVSIESETGELGLCGPSADKVSAPTQAPCLSAPIDTMYRHLYVILQHNYAIWMSDLKNRFLFEMFMTCSY